MDLSYNAVASKCAAQMAKYQECVLANQNADWSTICAPLGRELTKCADESVPHLKELKERCAKDIAAYRQCLDRHGSLPDDAIADLCGASMNKVWECSERSMKAIEARAPIASSVASKAGDLGTKASTSSGTQERLV